MSGTRVQDNSPPWFIVPKPLSAPGARIFCFPPAGSGARFFGHWAEYAGASLEVWAVELPGRGTRQREVPYENFDLVLTALADALRPHLAFPFALFGLSMGAFLAFELTRLLERRHCQRPVHLFVSGCSAPNLPTVPSLTSTLSDDRLLQELHKLNGTPLSVLQSSEMMRYFLPVIRSDLSLSESYVYDAGPKVECPITAFAGKGDTEVTPQGLDAWRFQTTSRFAMSWLDCGHFPSGTAEEKMVTEISTQISRVDLVG